MSRTAFGSTRLTPSCLKKEKEKKKRKKEEKEAAIPECGGGKEARLHLTLLCHHQNGFRLKDGQR